MYKYLHTPIEQIDRKEYRRFLNKYGRKHAKSTVSKYNSLYHACVKEVLYDGDIKRDFIENVDLVFNKDKTRSVEYLNIDDMQKLYGYLIQTRNRHFTGKYMILTVLLTGARLDEIQELI